MFAKLIIVAIVASQVVCLTEIRLNDLNVHYIKHPLIGTSLDIPPDSFDDTLLNCNIVFPNGILYAVYPSRDHPTLDHSAEPKVLGPRCSVQIRNVGSEYSGTYELLATVRKAGDNSIVVTRRKFNLQVVESDFS